MWLLLLEACWQTIYMVFLASLIAGVVGMFMGVILYVTHEHHILEMPWLNKSLALLVNIVRSIPFVILMVAVIPLTRFMTGTSIGTTAAIVPLSLAAIPFVTRVVEAALFEVDEGLVEAVLAMGATPLQIIRKVLIPEAAPSISKGLTLTVVNLIGYSAMAGAIGGGGLGDLAIRYGYERFDVVIMLATIVVMIILVQGVQALGDRLAWLLRFQRKK